MHDQIKELLRFRRCKLRATIIGIDGIDAAGKTTYARSLADCLEQDDIETVIIHLDDFHKPRQERRDTQLPPPQAYYYNTFDYDTLIRELLQPIHAGQSFAKVLHCLDLERDEYCNARRFKISPRSVVIIEGVFLLRPELASFIDIKVHLYIDLACCLSRVKTRDGTLFGSVEETVLRYESKYIPGQKLYYQEADPLNRADLVIDNTNFANPVPKK